MTKNLNLSILMDFYGQLLSKRQQDMMDMYYNQDLSLAEIADETGISRQGVRDAIKRGEKQLFQFEEKLGLAQRFLFISSQLEEINKIADSLENSEKIVRMKELLNGLSEEI